MTDNALWRKDREFVAALLQHPHTLGLLSAAVIAAVDVLTPLGEILITLVAFGDGAFFPYLLGKKSSRILYYASVGYEKMQSCQAEALVKRRARDIERTALWAEDAGLKRQVRVAEAGGHDVTPLLARRIEIRRRLDSLGAV